MAPKVFSDIFSVGRNLSVRKALYGKYKDVYEV